MLCLLSINVLPSKATANGLDTQFNTISNTIYDVSSYLSSMQLNDGTWEKSEGDTATIAHINYLYGDVNFGVRVLEKSLLHYEYGDDLNVDSISNRLLLSPVCETWEVDYVKSCQNSDGGFGLSEAV